jgi:hypothetical protein
MLDTIRPLHFDEREALKWAMGQAQEDERSRRAEDVTQEHEVPRGE